MWLKQQTEKDVFISDYAVQSCCAMLTLNTTNPYLKLDPGPCYTVLTVVEFLRNLFISLNKKIDFVLFVMAPVAKFFLLSVY